jgi:hypothetical protein
MFGCLSACAYCGFEGYYKPASGTVTWSAVLVTAFASPWKEIFSVFVHLFYILNSK